MTTNEDQERSEKPKIPREVYEAARSAMQQREAVPGRPECGPYPATLDELAESIVDAIWPLAYRAGREDAAAGRIQRAIDIALEYGGTDGAHHKMWTIDQMLRCLAGDRYEQLIAEHEWDEGITP